MACTPIQCVALDIGPLNTGPKLRKVSHANNRVPILVGRHTVDKVNEAVLEPPGIEPVDYMDDEGWLR
jgi:hypothetical protein